LVFALNIAQQSSGWFTATDLAYFLVLAGMFQCHDRDGRTGLPADLRRYVVTTTLVGLGLWVLVNLIGNHGLGR
jgi:uncharacterized membrane protein